MKPRIVFLMVALLLITLPGFAAAGQGVTGAVYVMTNDPGGNKVVIFNRDVKGALTLADSVATGGLGSGGGLDPLQSQGSLRISADNRWVLAVNAGSNEISAFRVLPDGGLKKTDTVDSGGEFPTSIAVYHDLVYVLNAKSPNITGFNLGHTGKLTLLADSTRGLTGEGFAQVGFDPQAKQLVITNTGGNQILVFPIDRDGLPGMAPTTTPSNGAGPFGFVFDRQGHLLVSEAGAHAVSSYNILPDGMLQVISPSVVAPGQIATCWIAVTPEGRFAFTSNTGSDTISAYRIQHGSGKLFLLDATAGSDNGLNGPIDSAITKNGRFLYVLNGSNGTVGMFRINPKGPKGSLTELGAIKILPNPFEFAQGIAAK
jgi:6-phosphogluconolactonase